MALGISVASIESDRLPDDLVRVEQGIAAEVEFPSRFVAAVASQIAQAGGKRLRPMLCLCSAYALQARGDRSPAADRVVTAAVAVELLHMGTLYHDDVMDHAETRRGVPSPNAVWGNEVAILGGDVLLAASAALCASLGATEAQLIAETLKTLCVGQLLETEQLFNCDRDESSYSAAIAGKTATLMATSCTLGALEAGATEDELDVFYSFGHNLGMAFQIIDDVLDLVADEHLLGKPANNDITEGVYTLPTLIALREVPALRTLLHAEISPEECAEARRVILDTSAVRNALKVASENVGEAREALEAIERTRGRRLDGLRRVTDEITRPVEDPDQFINSIRAASG